jgi:hypothetical protein
MGFPAWLRRFERGKPAYESAGQTPTLAQDLGLCDADSPVRTIEAVSGPGILDAVSAREAGGALVV